MSLAKAKAVGRRRRRAGQLWPMPIRETDLGHIYTEFQGRQAGATLVFAGEGEEPLLGVTILESAGFWIDPSRERLIPRPPKRKQHTPK